MNSARIVNAFGRLDRIPEVFGAVRQFDRGLVLTAQYLGLRSPRYPGMVVSRSGDQYRIEEFGDVETLWQIAARGVYDVRPDDRCIVDAGANTGLFTCYACSVAPSARVLAIEPFPPSHRRLLDSVSRNSLESRVTVLPVALAGTPGTEVMCISYRSSQENWIQRQAGLQGQLRLRASCDAQ